MAEATPPASTSDERPSTPTKSTSTSESQGRIYDVDEQTLNSLTSDDGRTPHASPPAPHAALAPLSSSSSTEPTGSPASTRTPSEQSTPSTSPEGDGPHSTQPAETLPPSSHPTSSPTQNGGLSADLFDVNSSSSPLFPSPSSSFRPPPEFESDLTSRLDERIASEKGKKNPTEGADSEVATTTSTPPTPTTAAAAAATVASGTTGSLRESRDSRPVRPPSRPPSRPASSDRARPSSGLGYTSDRKPRTGAGGQDDWTPRMSLNSSVAYPTEILVIVRDFAFESTDPRYKGEPHPDAVVRGGRASSRASRDDLSEAESPALGNEAFASSGSSGFSWGFVTSHQTDFASEDDSQVYSEDDYLQDDPLGEFVPGVYVAMYDFEPELETEMAIKEGESVNVLSRQCAGWVQASRPHEPIDLDVAKLVPENYLMLKEAFPDGFLDGGHHLPSLVENDQVYEVPDHHELDGVGEVEKGHSGTKEGETEFVENSEEVSTPRPILEEDDPPVSVSVSVSVSSEE